MQKLKVKGFFLHGISVRTTYVNGQAAKDIGELWGRFMENNVLLKIVDRISDEIYCVYTDYETDYTGFYTAVLGCRVNTLNNIPEGLISLIIVPGDCMKYVVKGRLPDCVASTWQQIWQSDMPRTYIADFDLYNFKEQDPENAEVEIYVGVK